MDRKILSPTPVLVIAALLLAILTLAGSSACGGEGDRSRTGSGVAGVDRAATLRTSGSAVYYLNRNQQESGDHEVHREDCPEYLPARQNRVRLGRFAHCRDAVEEARERGYPTADGCYLCAPACNTG